MSNSTREREGIRRIEGKRGVSWQASIRNSGQKPVYKTFSTRNAAKQWKKSTQAAIQERRYFAYAEADKHSLGEMIQRYLDTESPVSSKRLCLEKWRDDIGHRLLSDISAADIVEYRDKLKVGIIGKGKQRAPATVNRYLAYLSTVYTTAIKEWQWVQINPVKAVKKLPEPKGRVRYLSEEEISALLDACKQSDSGNLYPMVVLALSCGARAGELLDLRWQDVDLRRGMAVLHNTKNGDRRSISIKGRAQRVLTDHAKVRRMDTDRVFPRDNGDARYRYNGPFREAANAAKIVDFRFHDLRHTAASYLAMNGATIPEIAAVLGHKSWAMAMRYSHLSDSHISGVVERMNEKILGAG